MAEGTLKKCENRKCRRTYLSPDGALTELTFCSVRCMKEEEQLVKDDVFWLLESMRKKKARKTKRGRELKRIQKKNKKQ